MTAWPRLALMGLVRLYRFALSPWLGSSCRFFPTCSAYSLDALEMHGAVVGTVLTVGRVARCHPWCTGGHDPVPADRADLFRSLLGRSATGPDARAASSEAST